VCGTYSDSDGPRLFVNAVEMAYASRSVGSGASGDDSVDDLYIGNRSTGDKGFDGIIDNVRLYNRVLSISDMQSDMNTPVGGSTDAGTDSGGTDSGGKDAGPTDSGVQDGACQGSAGHPAFVRQAYATPQGTVTSATVTLSTQAAGDANVVGIG